MDGGDGGAAGRHPRMAILALSSVTYLFKVGPGTESESMHEQRTLGSASCDVNTQFALRWCSCCPYPALVERRWAPWLERRGKARRARTTRDEELGYGTLQRWGRAIRKEVQRHACACNMHGSPRAPAPLALQFVAGHHDTRISGFPQFQVRSHDALSANSSINDPVLERGV